MVKEVYVLHEFAIIGAWQCVAAVCVAARWVCILCQAAVGYGLAIGSGEVGTVLDSLAHVYGYIVEIHGIAYEMTPLWLLLEQESAAWDAVALWQGLHGYGVVLKDDLVLCRVDVVEEYWVVHPLAEEIELWLHQLFQHLVCIDVEWGGTSQKAESGHQSDEAEAVVTVQVRYEDMVDEREMYVSPAEL